MIFADVCFTSNEFWDVADFSFFYIKQYMVLRMYLQLPNRIAMNLS